MQTDKINRIINHLVIHTSGINNLGLYDGKLGISIFFFHYSKLKKNKIYKIFAENILDDIYDKIDESVPISFKNGLCGIGWGILYLLKEKFINGDAKDILSDLDEYIMQRDIRRVKDLSNDTGLEGISYYIYERINRNISGKHSFDHIFLKEWNNELRRLKNFQAFDIKRISSENLSFEIDKITNCRLGLSTGCSGYLFNTLIS